MFSRSLRGIAISLALVGCAGTGDEPRRARALSAAQLDLIDNSALFPAADWWLSINDDQLSALIDQAQRENPSLHIAQARVELAQTVVRGTRAANQPTLDLNGHLFRERFSENDIYPPPLGGSIENNARLALDFSYEFDFWGKQRATLEAALKDIDVANADRSAAQMVLSIAVAQSYFALQHAFVDRDLTMQVAKERDALLTLTQLRVKRGLASASEIDSVQASAANAQSDVAQVQQYIDTEKNQLAALCGVSSEQLPPIAVTNSSAIDFVAPSSVPADLLGRRADIVAQRLRVEAEAQHVEVAKADFYPNIDLTGFFGLQSVQTGHLFDIGSRAWAVGPALHLPIFNRDALRAQLGSHHAIYNIAVEQYNKSVLDAVHETTDAGSALRTLTAQLAAVNSAADALQRAHATSALRYQRGLGNQLDVMAAEIALLNQKRALNAVNSARTHAQLALIRALGGGYDNVQATKN